MTDSTEWTDVTLPFLRAVHDARENRSGAGEREVALLGDDSVARRRWDTIDRAGLASGSFFWASGGALGMATEVRLEARGLRAIGEWPSAGTELDVLEALLAKQEAAEDDDEERGRLRQLREAVAALGRDTGRALVTELVKQAVAAAQ